jgi:glyoxylase-like metal-dependent hydrolase (beta-lactamase superfamily II)
MQQEGRFRSVEGLYVTHYHSDHTNHVAQAAQALRCPVYACREMKDILERPQAFAMPVETATPIRPVTAMGEGQTQRWHEFEFTYSHFPGQTWYHGGLLVKKDGGETIFFAGDSFTPTGMDDYCLLNRNFVEPEKGYTYCLNVLKRTPGWLVNQHVDPIFRYTPAQIDLMQANFTARSALFRALFPWDDPNYGLDERWARFYPYSAEARPGQALELQFVILNHSATRREFRVTPHAPAGWNAGDPLQLSLAPREEKAVPIRVTPGGGVRGVQVITADVAFGTWDLREWAEAIVAVGP